MRRKTRVIAKTAAEWTALNPLLAKGQPGFESDTRKTKTGDGVLYWAALLYNAGGDSSSPFPIATATGTVDAITAVFTTPLTLTDKVMCSLVALGANTIAAPTFAPDGLAARTITKNGGQPLVAGDIPAAGAVIILEYNLAGLRWEIVDVQGDTLVTEGALINSATSKDTPVDADQIPLMDSAGGNVLKKLSWANFKAAILTFLYGYSTVPSAATVDLGASTRVTHISGTATISSFGVVAPGIIRTVIFDGALILTNSANLLLPGGANITTIAGDAAVFVSEGSGNWKCVSYESNTDGVWIAYSPTFSGFSADPTAVSARYFLEGKRCTVTIRATAGTSNATTFTMTLPFAARGTEYYVGVVQDNSAFQSSSGRLTTAASSNVANIGKTLSSAGGFTASGTKMWYGTITYEIQ